MRKDIKKLLDKISGKKVNNISITATSPWDRSSFQLNFNIEITEAIFFDLGSGKVYLISLYLNISDRTINGEVDEEEFEWRFQNKNLQDDLKEILYEKYKIELFGVSYFDVEEYKFI